MEARERAQAARGMKRMQLFNGIEPQDIAQGTLGDCIVALAEHPSAVRRLFVNHEINDRGKYQVRLYNPKGKFQIITIDDYIPVDSNGTPICQKRAARFGCAYSRRRSPSSGPRSTPKATARGTRAS